MVPFDYIRPTDWSDAVRLVAEPGAVAKMGGCDVMTRYRRGRLNARLVVGLNSLPGIGELNFGVDGVRIAAGVTLAQLARHPTFARGWPVLADVIGSIASPAIRTTATVVGNVAQGWGVSDVVPLLQVCDAELEIVSASGQRHIALIEYAKKPKSEALNSGELIAALKIPALSADDCVAYERFSYRNGFDLPLVAVAIAAASRAGGYASVRVAVVGGSRMPARCPPVETVLEGSRDLESARDGAMDALHRWAEPPADRRTSAAYRRHVLAVTLRRALSKLAAA